MRVLFLTQTSQRGPSSRVRGYQMAEQLRRLEVQTFVSPGVGNLFYPWVYRHDIPLLKAPFYAAALAKRIWQLSWIKKFDLVVIQKPVVPHLYPFFETLLSKIGVPFIFDMDDALFARDPNPARLPAILKRAAAVTVGNKYLYDYAKCFNPRCFIFPSAMDLHQVTPKRKFPTNGTTYLGWIGSRTTWVQLDGIREVLESVLAKEKDIKLFLVADHLPSHWRHLVSAGKAEFKKWSFARENEYLQKMDIGLAPLLPGPWSEGKCGYKLVQYLAHGLPILASPVGVQPEMVWEGKNGFLASTPQEWSEKLSQLLAQRGEWDKMGRYSRHLAEQNYSLEAQSRRLKLLMEEICREKKKR